MSRIHYGLGMPESAEEITRWINAVLGVKPHKGVNARHPGVQRLVRWVNNKLSTNPNATIGEKQLLSYATQWIPEHLCTRQQNSTVVPKLFPLVIDIGDGILQMIQSESYETNGFASMFFDCNRFVLMGFYADE